jgi:hypothetical protein
VYSLYGLYVNRDVVVGRSLVDLTVCLVLRPVVEIKVLREFVALVAESLLNVFVKAKAGSLGEIGVLFRDVVQSARKFGAGHLSVITFFLIKLYP